jgi:hypothetical protein
MKKGDKSKDKKKKEKMAKDKKTRVKRKRKKIPFVIISCITTLIVIIITLGVIVPLHLCFPNIMTSCWVIAISIAVISPFALVNSKIYMESKVKYTEEQKKNVSRNIVISLLSIWWADFAFVCMFMNWLIAFFLLAGLYLIKMVYGVAVAFINRNNKLSYPSVFIVGDFVLSILLIILMIYKIPDRSLQTIVLSLVAALIGGLLTLTGVMLTIRKSDKDREIERRNQAKPFFYYTPYFGGPEYHNNIKTCHDKQFVKGIKKNNSVFLGRFVNSDKVEFLIKSIIINNEECECDFDPAVSKGELFEIVLFTENEIERPNDYTLKIEDIDQRIRLVKISIEYDENESIPKSIEFID